MNEIRRIWKLSLSWNKGFDWLARLWGTPLWPSCLTACGASFRERRWSRLQKRLGFTRIILELNMKWTYWQPKWAWHSQRCKDGCTCRLVHSLSHGFLASKFLISEILNFALTHIVRERTQRRKQVDHASDSEKSYCSAGTLKSGTFILSFLLITRTLTTSHDRNLEERLGARIVSIRWAARRVVAAWDMNEEPRAEAPMTLIWEHLFWSTDSQDRADTEKQLASL